MDSNIYNLLVMAHSIGRWIVLLLLLIAIFKSIGAGDKPFTACQDRISLFLTILADLMSRIVLYSWLAGAWRYHSLKTNCGVGEVMKDHVALSYEV
jgi:hypothetical protein